MSRVMRAFPVRAGTKYPWRKWLDGRVHQLTRGVDFECEPERLRHQVYEYAARLGLKARAAVTDDKVYVLATGSRSKPSRMRSLAEQQSFARGDSE